MAVKHTMIIRANMTAYSTAVGPSSETRKRCTFKARFFIASSKRCGRRLDADEHTPPGKYESARRSDSHKPPACLAPGQNSHTCVARLVIVARFIRQLHSPS